MIVPAQIKTILPFPKYIELVKGISNGYFGITIRVITDSVVDVQYEDIRNEFSLNETRNWIVVEYIKNIRGKEYSMHFKSNTDEESYNAQCERIEKTYQDFISKFPDIIIEPEKVEAPTKPKLVGPNKFKIHFWLENYWIFGRGIDYDFR